MQVWLGVVSVLRQVSERTRPEELEARRKAQCSSHQLETVAVHTTWQERDTIRVMCLKQASKARLEFGQLPSGRIEASKATGRSVALSDTHCVERFTTLISSSEGCTSDEYDPRNRDRVSPPNRHVLPRPLCKLLGRSSHGPEEFMNSGPAERRLLYRLKEAFFWNSRKASGQVDTPVMMPKNRTTRGVLRAFVGSRIWFTQPKAFDYM